MNDFSLFDSLERLKGDGFARFRFELHSRWFLEGLDRNESDVL